MKLAGLLFLLVPSFVTAAAWTIDKECGEKMPALVDDAMKIGTACLVKLDGPGSRENLKRLEALLKHGITLSCSDKDRAWEDAIGYGTLPGDKNFARISLNPKYVHDKEAPDLRGTILHEVFHNLGYAHYTHVEYPYACQTCCLPHPLESKESRAAACQLCRSEYQDVYDKNYLKDVLSFYDKSFRRDRSVETLETVLAKHPTDRNLRFQYAETLRQSHLMLGLGFIDALRDVYRQDLTDREREIFAYPPKADAEMKVRLDAARALGRTYLAILDERFGDAEKELREFRTSKSDAKFEAVAERYIWRVYDHHKKRQAAARGTLERVDAKAASRRVFELLPDVKPSLPPYEGRGIRDERRNLKVDAVFKIETLRDAVAKLEFKELGREVHQALGRAFIGVPETSRGTLTDTGVALVFSDDKGSFRVTIDFVRRDKQIVDYNLTVDGK